MRDVFFFFLTKIIKKQLNGDKVEFPRFKKRLQYVMGYLEGLGNKSGELNVAFRISFTEIHFPACTWVSLVLAAVFHSILS